MDLSTLSPRLRKLVEFYGVDGYVPSFPETPSPRGDSQKNNTASCEVSDCCIDPKFIYSGVGYDGSLCWVY